MSMPSDASIRTAYQETKNVPLGEWWYAKVLERAAEIDAKPAPLLVKCPRCPALVPPGVSCAGNPPNDPCPLRK